MVLKGEFKERHPVYIPQRNLAVILCVAHRE
jgi:hypothetical protein